jgi:glycosyltransferase involved in cell wall biosynthesis
MAISSPLVSIGMPVRNCEATLGLAIRSLLLQSYYNWELLLIDDGSTDKTHNIAAQFSDPRIKASMDGMFRGLIFRLNEAIHMSSGKYFARMDGDDIAYPERLEKQVSYLEMHPEIDLVGAWMIVFGPNGIPFGKRTYPEMHTGICAKPFARVRISHPTFVGRIEWFRRYGYRKEAIRCEDQDLLLRSYRFTQFANVPEILLGYREERIDLKKVLKSRRFWSSCLLHEFLEQRRPDIAVRAVVEQIAKGILDCIAVSTGLNYRLLRHRALPITDAERSEWEQVWEEVNKNLMKGLR